MNSARLSVATPSATGEG